ncbi:CHRD domain-containing protein [Pedobacter sp. MW01-1-1]|uniref:CHRD domain-containing protein n=1 Tax=Pedobacter sp. MW01-1-1 TaxID=3383027 RepID=UPI003FEEA115
MKIKILSRGFMLLCIFIMSVHSSCKKDVYTSDIFIAKQWKVDLSASSVVPAITGRTDHAVAMVYLMSNNELHYDIYFDIALQNNDSPGKGQLFLGDLGQLGTLFLDLQTPAFNSERECKGSVKLDEGSVAKLMTDKIYLQVSSTQQPNGLVRGKLN